SHLFALCDDQAGLAVQESTNGGRTWAPLNRPVPSFVLGEQPPLVASADAQHLALVGAGNYAMTTDGGRTWSAEAFLPGAESNPAAIEVNERGEIMVYPTSEQAGPDLAFWRSDDAGATWQVVTPRGDAASPVLRPRAIGHAGHMKDLPPGYPREWEADVVLTDGSVAHVRPIVPDDIEAIHTFHSKQSPESIYLRFFAPVPRLSDKDVHRFTHVDYDKRVALVMMI